MFSWQIPWQMRERKKREGKGVRSGKTMMEYNGKDEREKQGEIEKERDETEKRGFVKSHRRRMCTARVNRTYKYCRNASNKSEAFPCWKTKRSRVSDGLMAAVRVTPIYCRIKARHH